MAVLLLFSMAKAGCWSLGSGKFTFIPSRAIWGQGEVLKGECAGELVRSCLGSSWAAWAREFPGNADEELETALGGTLHLLVSNLILSCCACFFFFYSEMVLFLLLLFAPLPRGGISKWLFIMCWKLWGGYIWGENRKTLWPQWKSFPKGFSSQRGNGV